MPLSAIVFLPTGNAISANGNSYADSNRRLRIRHIYNSGPLRALTLVLEYPPMAAGTRNVRIFVSQQCFGLLVDAMGAYSKRTRRFQTMRMTVQAACEGLKSHGFSKDDLDQFLSEYPIDGDISVWLEVTPKWASDYDALRDRLKEVSVKHGIDKMLVPFAVYLAVTANLL